MRKHHEIKNFQGCHWVDFVLATYCLAWGLSLGVVCIPSETPLEKLTFPELGIGACVYIFQPGTLSCAELWRPCACFHSLYHTVLILECLQGLASLLSPVLSGSRNHSTHSSAGSLSTERRNFQETSHLGLNVSISHSPHIVHYGFQYLFPSKKASLMMAEKVKIKV